MGWWRGDATAPCHRLHKSPAPVSTLIACQRPQLMQRGVTVSLMFHYNEPFLRNKKKKTKKQRRQWDQKKREINVPISDVVKYIKKNKRSSRQDYYHTAAADTNRKLTNINVLFSPTRGSFTFCFVFCFFWWVCWRWMEPV